MVNKSINIQLISALACLLFGAIIYSFFRSRETIGFFILDSVGLNFNLDTPRNLLQKKCIPDFVRFCLPDGLWATSYILFSDYINKKEETRTRIALASVISIVGITIELLQLTSIVKGTFDILDMACYTIPLFVYIVYTYFILQKK